MRFVIAICIGVGGTLGWQSYGDKVREMIAGAYPQLGWLSPRVAAAQTIPAAMDAPARPADAQQIQELALTLAAMRQRVDQLAFQITTGQDQMARDITAKVQAAERDILDRMAVAQPRQQEAARKPAAAPPPLR
jgi:hypothetical protein